MHRAECIGNKILYDRMQQRSMNKHKQRLNTMKSSFTSNAASTSTNNGMSINLKRAYYKRQRNTTVDRDNQLLLGRMKDIANRYNMYAGLGSTGNNSASSPTKNTAAAASSPPSTTKYHPHPHVQISHAARHDQISSKHLLDAERKRHLDVQKIQAENIRFARKLETAKGKYSVAKAREEWSQNRDYLENITTYPVVTEIFGPRSPRSGKSPRGSSKNTWNNSPRRKNKVPEPRRPSTTEPGIRKRRNQKNQNSNGGRGRNGGGSSGRAGRNVVQPQQHRSSSRAKRTRPTNNSGQRSRPATTASISMSNGAGKMLITSPATAAAMENNGQTSTFDVNSTVMSHLSPSVTWSATNVKIGSETYSVCGFSLGKEHGGVLFEARSKKLSGVVYRLTATRANVQKALSAMKKMTLIGVPLVQPTRPAASSSTSSSTTSSSISSINTNNQHADSIELLARNCLKLILYKRRLKLVVVQPELSLAQIDTQNACIQIQSRARGYFHRKKLQQQHQHANVVQRHHRGRMVRNQISEVKTRKKAAVALQASERGRQGRRMLKVRKAATCVQKSERGRQARKSLSKLKEEKRQELKVQERQERHRVLIEKRQERNSPKKQVAGTAKTKAKAKAKQEAKAKEKAKAKANEEAKAKTNKEAKAKTKIKATEGDTKKNIDPVVESVEMNQPVDIVKRAVTKKLATPNDSTKASNNQEVLHTMFPGTDDLNDDGDDAKQTIIVQETEHAQPTGLFGPQFSPESSNATVPGVEEADASHVEDMFEQSYIFVKEDDKEDVNEDVGNDQVAEKQPQVEQQKQEEEKEGVNLLLVEDMFEQSYIFTKDEEQVTKKDVEKEEIIDALTETEAEEESPDTSHVEDMFEQSYIFTTDEEKAKKEKEVSEAIPSTNGPPAVKEAETANLLEAGINLAAKVVDGDNDIGLTGAAQEQSPPQKQPPQDHQQQQQKEEEPDTSHVEDMFEQSYVFGNKDDKIGNDIKTIKDRSRSEIDDNEMTIAGLLAKSQTTTRDSTDEDPMEQEQTEEPQQAQDNEEDTEEKEQEKEEEEEEEDTSMSVTKGITIANNAKDGENTIHVLVKLEYELMKETMDTEMYISVYEPLTSIQHISLLLDGDIEILNVFQFIHSPTWKNEVTEKMLLKGLNQLEFKCVGNEATNYKIVFVDEQLNDKLKTSNGTTVDDEEATGEELSAGEFTADESEDEYHIDVSQLDDKGLTAIRNNLDELFSEFDTRGQGVLQQDDVRRLILQWAGNSNPITERGSFQPPPMLKPTSLPRDEVVAFVAHLDRDGDGHIDITEFCDFIIEGMSLDINDRLLYSKQSSLHTKLMNIITNVERRLVCMTLNGEQFGSGGEEEEVQAPVDILKKEQQEQQEQQPPISTTSTTATTTTTATFQVNAEHYDVALRALFRNYDKKTGALNEEALAELMVDYSKGDSELHPSQEEVTTFIDAMDENGDGSIDEHELVQFFQKGYTLSTAKRKKFSERSSMHMKMMRIISMTEDTVNRHITAVHDLFVQFDAQQSGALNSIEIGNMIRSTISSDVTNNEVDLFVNALDYDATGAVHFNDLLKFFLKGLNLNRTKRMQFASRSEFHGKLNLFMEYILDREAEMENV